MDVRKEKPWSVSNGKFRDYIWLKVTKLDRKSGSKKTCENIASNFVRWIKLYISGLGTWKE